MNRPSKSFALMAVGVVTFGFALGFFAAIFRVSADQYRDDRKTISELHEDLEDACRLLDEMSFDGDPWPCLDSEGNPYNR